jgi:lysophospholipase L1-like esterase
MYLFIIAYNHLLTSQLFLCGANDACLPGAKSGQHIPLDEYQKNLKAILIHPSIKKHRPKILLVTPPPVHEVHLESEDREKGDSLTRNQETTSKYADAVRRIAKEFQDQNVVLVDLWSALLNEAAKLSRDHDESRFLLGSLERGDNEGLRALLVDGLHLTGEGYKIFLGEVLPHVGTSWPEENPMAPSWLFP